MAGVLRVFSQLVGGGGVVRIPMLPFSLVLVVGGLLYAAFNMNRDLLEVTDERPMLAFATARDLATTAQSNAVRYWRELGRWPQSLADVNLDEQWMSRHRGIESIRYGADGTVRVGLSSASNGPATLIVWTPRQYGERMLWDCESDLPEIGKHIEGCVAVDAATLANSAAAAPSEDAQIEVSDLSERCQALGKVAYAAAQARDTGDPLETFIRRPVVAFVDDQKLRGDLESLARWVYESTPRTANATQRDVLRRYRCTAS
jgi:hypothetical protein